jgi:SAM-dependent methyltransferase
VGRPTQADRARVFDIVAEDYDRFRPPYPEAMYDAIWSADPALGRHGVVVEVGSGTGIATAGLARRAGSVICVEPGAQLVAQARRRLAGENGISWVSTGFEEWDGPGRPVDLVFAGDAWHWLDAAAGPDLAARVLRPGGVLALAWHQARRMSGPLAEEIAAGYTRWAPDIARAVLADAPALHAESIAALRASPRFELVESRTFELVRELSADDYTGLLGTYSDHALLEPHVRRSLFGHVRGAIERHGGTLTKVDDVLLFLARHAPAQEGPEQLRP